MKIRLVMIFALILSFPALCLARAERGTDSATTALLLNALKEYNSGNYTQAKGDFQKLAAIDPQNDAAYYYLANIALRTDDLPSGELYLKKGIEIDSSNFWYRDMLGQVYIKANKIKEAISVYEGLLRMHPKKSALHYTLVNLYLGSQQTEEAKGILEKIEASQGKSEAVAMTWFNIYRMEQNWEKALNYLVEFDREFQSPRIQCVIGDMYADRYKDTLAIHYYNKALELDRQCAPAMYGRAEVHRMNGNYPLFFADINPFLANPQIDSKMKIEYLKQLFQIPNFIKRYRLQLDNAMEGIALAHPADTTSNMFLAAYYGEIGDNAKCKEFLRKNYTLYPDKFSTLFQWVLAIYQLKEWENLEAATTEALEKYPHHPDLVQLRGIARFQMKQTDKAIESYRELEEISLKNRDTVSLISAYSILGDLHYEKKESKTAFSYYRKVLKLNPNETGALNNYAYYLALEGKNLKQAYQMSKKTVEAEPDNPTYLDTFGWILFLMDKPLEAKAQFKHAMLYGGTESADILDHYAEVLFSLGEHDLAFIYWNQAKQLDNTLGIDEKIKERKAQLKK
ncbi:MAG: tetratricopeptide repeat protein [Bacteroidales bacterium]|nr:tetratricopeptide repeat protein [Bacteroidales bacterium]